MEDLLSMFGGGKIQDQLFLAMGRAADTSARTSATTVLASAADAVVDRQGKRAEYVEEKPSAFRLQHFMWAQGVADKSIANIQKLQVQVADTPPLMLSPLAGLLKFQ